MSRYLRTPLPGGTYFFTLRLQDQRSDLLIARIDLLRDVTRLCRQRWPFTIDAAVILPNRLHMIWTLPDDDADYAKRWRAIKSGFSRHAAKPTDVAPGNLIRSAKGIWQRGYWAHLIHDPDDLALHHHLIRSAPIHAGLVKQPRDWPYTSLHDQNAERAKTIAPAPSAPDPKVAVSASERVPTVAN